jgi:hypothetical protein
MTDVPSGLSPTLANETKRKVKVNVEYSKEYISLLHKDWIYFSVHGNIERVKCVC